MLAAQSNKKLMELFLWSTQNVIEPLGFEISILGYKFVLETTLRFLDLHNVKTLKDIAYDIAYDIVYDIIKFISYTIYDIVYDIVYSRIYIYIIIYNIYIYILYLYRVLERNSWW